MKNTYTRLFDKIRHGVSKGTRKVSSKSTLDAQEPLDLAATQVTKAGLAVKKPRGKKLIAHEAEKSSEDELSMGLNESNKSDQDPLLAQNEAELTGDAIASGSDQDDSGGMIFSGADQDVVAAAAGGGMGVWGLLGGLGLLGGVAAAMSSSNNSSSSNVTLPDTTAPVVSSTVNPITADNIINAAESGATLPVTGTVSGDYKVGDSVTVTVGGNTYTTTVQSGGVFSVDVPGSVLAANPSQVVTAQVTSTDAAGNIGYGTSSITYAVDTTVPTPVIQLDVVTADNVLNATEAGQSIPINGTVAGANAGDVVTVEVDGQSYATVVQSNGSFSVNVPGSVLATASTISARCEHHGYGG